MKSFFKKLAFVMALAMVVSLAAPAAASAAVEGWEGVYLCEQYDETEEPIVDVTLTEGESMDFRFIGAPSNWKDYKGRGWKIVEIIDNVPATADPTKARVSNTGFVRVYAEGIYEVQYRAEGEVVASATINVVPEEVVPTTPVDPVPTTPDVEPDPTTPVEPDPTTPVEPEPTTPVAPDEEFTVDQTSLTDLAVVFTNPESKYGADDVVLYLIYPKADSDDVIKIKWPIKSASKKNGVITLTPYRLNEGDTYRVVVGDEENYFDYKSEVGEVDTVVLKPKSYTTLINKEVEIDVELYANDGKINVTSKADDYDVELVIELIGEGDPAEAYAENLEKATSTKKYVELLQYVTIDVQAKVVKKDKVVAETTLTCPIQAVEEAEWTFDGEVVEWCFINTEDFDPAKDVVDWTNDTVPADKSYAGEYVIVLKIQNGTETYVTHEYAVHESHAKVNGADPKENILITGRVYKEGSTTELDLAQMDKISASYREIFFYSTDENLMLVDKTTGAVGVYAEAEVAFYVGLNDYSGDEDDENFIYAETAKIGPASYMKEIVTSDGKYACTVVSEELYDKKGVTVTFSANDQYGNPWESLVTYRASYYENNEKRTIDMTDGQLVLNGAIFNDTDNSATEVVTVEATDYVSGKKVTKDITVSIVSPKKENGQIVYDDMKKTNYNTEVTVVVDNDKVELKKIETVTGTIEIFVTSNGAKVMEYSEAFPAKPAYKLINSDDDMKTLVNGDRYISLKTPGGDYVKLEYVDGEITYTLNETLAAVSGVTGQEFKVAVAGDYTITYGTVWKNLKNGNNNLSLVKTAKLTVEPKLPTIGKVTVKGDDKLNEDCFNEDGTINPVWTAIEKLEFANLANVIGEGKTIDPDNLEVKAVVLNNAIIIQSMVLRVYNEDGTIYRVIRIYPENVISLKK